MRGEFGHLRETRYRQDARDDRRVDAGGDTTIAEAQEQPGIEEELGDRSRCPCVELSLQVFEVELRARRLGVHLRVGRYRDFEVGDLFQSRDEIRCIGITAGRGRINPAVCVRVAA